MRRCRMPATHTRDFDSPYTEPAGTRKPSQAEGERDQPGEDKRENEQYKLFILLHVQPVLPSFHSVIHV